MDTSGEGTVFGLDHRTGFSREHSGNGAQLPCANNDAAAATSSPLPVATRPSGRTPEDLGIVWFDAHGEFNTPETTTTGFIDGMGLAMAVGHCWKEMARGVPGFVPIPEENVVMAGVRAADVAELERFDASGVTVVGPDAGEQQMQALAEALDDLRSRVGRVYVHLDLDVLDAAEVGMANEYGIPGGMDRGQLEKALDLVRERFTVAAAGIASYDPSFDADGSVLHAAIAGAGLLTSPKTEAG